jgi:alanine racemase
VFFALSGENKDGHEFIGEAFERGVRSFVLSSEKFLTSEIKKYCNYLIVADVLEALQKIAHQQKQQNNRLLMVAVTGSNGKTIVKDWLSELLNGSFRVVKNPKSYNSQIGVPLSLWKIKKEHEIGIFEAGISRPGEMERLEGIIQPEIGIFTSLGTAHDENFDDHFEKALEKAQLFKHSSEVYYQDKYPEWKKALTIVNPDVKHRSWSQTNQTSAGIKVNIKAKGKSLSNVDIQLESGDQYHFSIPFHDSASIENGVNCILVCLRVGLKPGIIQHRLSRLHPVHMRLELKKHAFNGYLIDDSYNNDLGGLEVALKFLKGQVQREHHVVILSDILQSGLKSKELYQTVNHLLKNHAVNCLIGIGDGIAANRSEFKIKSLFYKDTAAFLDSKPIQELKDAVVLVKGARNFKFEKIVSAIEEKNHETVLEINLKSLENNLQVYRSLLKPETKLMVMVKAFAYGSGSLEVAQLLQFNRVDYLAVAYTDEAVFLRQNGITIPIMVMNPNRDNLEKILDYDLQPEVYSFKLLNSILTHVKERHEKVRIHLKLDTGMHRLGFERHDLDKLIALIQANKDYLKVEGVLSHLSSADSAEQNAFSLQQLAEFKALNDELCTKCEIKPLLHVLNSPGITRYPDFQFDMVRLGIGLYGYDPNQKVQEQLQPVAKLITSVSQVKRLKKGSTVGYSRRGKIKRDSEIATLAIGYADGYDRRFSEGQGYVLINDHPAPVVGSVCMDMIMVDVTGLEVKEGDRAIIFGEDPDIITLAKRIGTIPYELLTNIGERVKRSFISE